jgi:uncharacterized membrane protein YfcA
MAGGIILLTVMLFFFEPLTAIAVHGVVQLASNSSRAVIQRKHVAWELAGYYCIFLVPMAYLGAQVALELPPNLTRFLIGIFVMVATWRPGWLFLGASPERVRPRPRFVMLGAGIGFLSTIIGATGPLQAPFFLNLGLSRQGVVGTKATCQTLGHVAKTIVFGVVGFAFAQYAAVIGAMAVMVVCGTWIGSHLLERVDERTFLLLFRGTLTIIAARFILWDGWQLL